MKKIIENDVVSMEWDADYFFESNQSGFVAAINIYETPDGEVPVVFKDNKIFLLLDPDTDGVATADNIADVIKQCFKEDIELEEAFEEFYVSLGESGVLLNADVAESYGLSEDDIADIESRIEDLSGYWATEEFSMSD